MRVLVRKAISISTLVTAFTASLVTGAGPAGAAVSARQDVPAVDSAVSAQTAREVIDLVRLNPGAHKVGAASVELQPGLVATALPKIPGDVHTLGAPVQCESGHLCMYENAQDAWHGGGWLL